MWDRTHDAIKTTATNATSTSGKVNQSTGSSNLGNRGAIARTDTNERGVRSTSGDVPALAAATAGPISGPWLERSHMIKLFRIIGAGANAPTNWVIGQFTDEQHALDQYNSEYRRARSEGIDDGRPELEIIEDGREVEYWLAEAEVTHTHEKRDESFEIARWALARKQTGR